MSRRRVLLDGDPVGSLAQYEQNGGGAALGIAREMGAGGVLDELTISGLRGRGGAGFPVSLKWQSIVAGGDEVGERFVVANGAEGEPGTFKDRFLLRHNPYLLIEGLVIAARTVGASRCFVVLKRSFERESDAVRRAVSEMDAAGWLDDVRIELVAGPDEYLLGEEKALLEVIEGEDPLPRLFPPYIYGLFTTSPQMGWSAGSTLEQRTPDGSNPTLVNNIETLANVPLIVAKGGEWYRTMGTDESPGTIICTVSGDTTRHGVDEFEMGTPVREILESVGGGSEAGRQIRYVLSGVSNPVLRAADLDTPASYEAMAGVGSGLGTGGFIVYDDRTDPIELAAAVSRFLWVESCGQCPSCKLGCEHITGLLEDRSGSRTLDLSALSGRLNMVNDSARCYLPTQEQRLVGSLLGDIRAGIQGTRRDLVTTKLVDLVDDRFVVDERQRSKRPDWTYDP